MNLSSKGVPRGFQVVSKEVSGGFQRGKLLYTGGIGIYIFLKIILVHQYQNDIRLK